MGAYPPVQIRFTNTNTGDSTVSASERMPIRTGHRIPSTTPLFPTGQLLATPGALQVMAQHQVEPMKLLARHVSGDWGDVCDEDAQTNAQALLRGARIFSVYRLQHPSSRSAETIWVITEAGRHCTTFLLPSEY